jgi:hypothetical protein
MAVSGDELIVGGQFTTADGVAAKHLAKWNGNTWSAMGAGFDGDVWALAVAGSNVYAGGYFKAAGGNPASCIARWDGSSWSALGGGVDGNVFALTVSGSNLFAGGSFIYATNNGGVAVVANGIARWNGSEWVPLGLGTNNWVQTLASSGNDLYAGGLFTTAGGNQASRIVKWDGANWSTIGGLNSSVYSLASSGNILYAGGAFTRVTNGAGVSIAASRIAAWDGTNWSALGSGLDNTVKALVINTGKLYAGGLFSTAGGSPAQRICEWNGAAWSPLGAGINGVSPEVRSLASKGTDIYVGGWFTTAGGKISGHAAKWAPLAFQTGSINVSNGWFNVILTGPDTNSVIVEAASNLTDWTPIATNTLPVGGGWQTALPVGTNIHQSFRARLGP